MAEEMKKFFEAQSQLMQKMLKQYHEANVPAVPGDLSKQVIQFDSFNPKDEKFDCYLLRLENFFSIKKLSSESTEVDQAKKQILINSIGPKYIQLLRNSTAPDDPREKKYQELIDILKIHLAPKINIFSEQHKFLSRIQKQGESISTYVSALQELAITCEWVCPESSCQKTFASIILRAQFIRGLLDPDIRERLLLLPNQAKITFSALVEAAQSVELSKSDNKEIYKTPVNPVPVNKLNVRDSKINDKNQRQNYNRRPMYPPNRDSSTNRYSAPYKPRSKVDFKEIGIDGHCLRCGYTNHQVKDCSQNPEKFKCNLCSRIGHVDKVCVSTLLRNKRDSEKSKNSQRSDQYLVYDSDDGDMQDVQLIHRIEDDKFGFNLCP